MSSQNHISDGEKDFTADELVAGHLYVLVDRGDGKNHFKLLPRSEDDLPKIRITEEALDAIKALCGQMRKRLGGYKPDYTLVASALALWAAKHPDAPEVVREFALAKFQTAPLNGSTATGDDQ